jgi:stage III sporulation protein AE
MAAVVLVYKLAAAVVEPLGDERTAGVLKVFGDHLVLLMGTVAAVTLMFIIMISILAMTTNQVVLMR